ncbi:type A2 lantipeptide [Streptomyces sp. NPDC059740]|uniref:type A2 lantipeptide n=1 Tax=Streptomyces sp. NPDC059740 TaxID=3346926 RepID=UPI00364CC52C
MNSAPKVATQEISDADLDNVSGGMAGGPVAGLTDTVGATVGNTLGGVLGTVGGVNVQAGAGVHAGPVAAGGNVGVGL